MNKKHREYLECKLTQAEIVAIAKEQSGHLRDKSDLERQLISVRSDFKARIDDLDSKIGVATRKISDGFEMRAIECATQLNSPYIGQCEIVRLDTGEIIREREMLESEYQRILEFDAKNPSDPDIVETVESESKQKKQPAGETE